MTTLVNGNLMAINSTEEYAIIDVATLKYEMLPLATSLFEGARGNYGICAATLADSASKEACRIIKGCEVGLSKTSDIQKKKEYADMMSAAYSIIEESEEIINNNYGF